jgi:SAM-dependent methyltransferase
VVAGDGSSAREYWSRRLRSHYSLRGTGHLSYSDAYNGWLYRQKRRALRPVLSRIAPGDRVLDVGSGTGWVVSELLARGARVEGCDIAPVAVERLRPAFAAAEFFELALGAAPIPRPAGTFDAATALDVLYHVTDDREWEAALAELGRVLRAGGLLIASDGLGDRGRDPAAHVRFRSLARWRSAAAAAGLAIIELRPLFSWLSRDPEEGALARLPGRVRGPIEYALERSWPRSPHMRLVVLERARE